ncbi:hypothetical protein G9401_06180 [Weissella paramesenteroides]|uniref:hypothetical protein n=1 Tax=Weissella paramesenteroides TaxID=1249 RepID=UPI0023F913EA|nr:hypothetical protein [Weissella paramesenteroides]MDF8375168.1 hypothetical protein [Weissella paramesenteroides]
MENDETDSTNSSSTNSSADNTEYKKINWKLIIVIFFLLIAIFLILPIPWQKYWYEDNGHFPWIGVSAFIAAIGFIDNQRWERKKLNADIKSKSRINWMVTVRDLLASYTTDSERLYSTMIELARFLATIYLDKNNQVRQNVHISVQQQNDFLILNKRFNDESQKQTVEHRKLLLYIPVVPDNTEILSKIEDIETEVNSSRHKVTTWVNEPSIDNLENLLDEICYMKNSISEHDIQKRKTVLNNAIKDAICVGRSYFKGEWERAKKGK